MGNKNKSNQKEIVAAKPPAQIPVAPIRRLSIPVPPKPRNEIRKGINMANLTTVTDGKFSKKMCVQQFGMNSHTQHTQVVEQYVQYPSANYIKKPEVQSTYQMTPVEEMRYPGRDIQQLPSQLYPTPFLQSSVPNQDLSNTVARTSVGAECAKARKEIIEVDLTKDETKVALTKEEKDVDLTKDVIEVECMKDVIEVDRWNVARLLDAQPDIVSDTSPDIWHKVIVTSDLVDRVAVLNAINKQISPMKITPYFFRMEDGHMTFLVNNCSAALKTLFKQNLVLQSINTPIHLKVQLRAKKVNLDAILQRVVRKRLSAVQPCFLDLSDLTSIPEIQQVVYDPSDTSHLQQQLVRMALERVPSLTSFSLAGNEISTLRHLTSVLANKVKWSSLRVLDLSHNKILSKRELVVIFKSIHSNPTELYLHNNPVCGKFGDNLTYTRAVKKHFPSVIKLDGVHLMSTPSLPQWRPNYILCSSHGDPGELADQFLEHFFTLYDGEDRALLRGMYHEDAYFSVSSMYLPGQSTSLCARLTSYVAESRNLLNSSSRLRTKAALCKGPEKILEKLEKLPRTRHNPYTFTVDVLHHSDTSAILTVTGVFEEQTQIENISPRHFMRTFVLVRLANDEYQIVNDIVYVTNTTTAETEVAFRYNEPRKIVKKIQQPSHVTEREKNSITERDSQLTDMRPEWSLKAIRKHIPSVIKLDGVHLMSTPCLPQWRQNYILCSSHGDPAELADQFLERFFTLYDGADRALLRGMYHEDAYFSVSSMYLPGQSTSLCARLSSYVAESRNLLNSSSRLKTKAALCKGPEKILTKLDKLPRTRHNPYTFTVDVLHHTDTSAILTVTGVFEEQNQIENISPRHFMRTFVLVRLANDEYQIVNDIVYVTNTTTAETEVAFRYNEPRKIVKKIQQPSHVTEREKNSMTERDSQLTDMRPEWSLKAIRKHIPSVIELDGVHLISMPSLPQWRQNYILCSSHGDRAELADQFLEHFFTLYDGEDRALLRGMYHEDAYFSVSSMYLPGQSTSLCARLSSYVAESRNLLNSSSRLRTKAALCKGPEKILTKLDKLPRTRHNPYTFTVDVLHHSDTSAILTVTGVFEEQNQIENISPRHFMRTFVLVRLANDEYQIVNDIVYVTNTTTAETEVAFRYKKPCKNVKKIQQLSHVTEKEKNSMTEREKNSMTERDSQLTDMRPEWSFKAIRKHIPSVIELDGVHLISMPSLPQWRQNYILCSSHGDRAELADQFLEHFFTLYDGEDRALLRGMYHEDAYFSVSSMYLPGQSTSLCARLSSYVAESRNLLNSSSRLRTKAALCKGPEKILTKLDKLPRTRHNPYTFTVDVLHHSDTSAILTVTGVFEEQNQIENISPRHFMRTFVLVRLANDEYQIVNDIVYVTNTTTAETEVAFRYKKPCKNVKKIQQPSHVTEKEKNSMTEREKNSKTERDSQLTNIRPEWSLKAIRKHIPSVIKLDGVYLMSTPGLPQWRPNYILCSSLGDPAELADQFLERFFTLYDGEDRALLRGLYHEDAYFSVSSMYLPGQSTSLCARLSSYVAESRNLLNSSSRLRTKAALCKGPEKILTKLDKLPRTRHNPYTFTVDVLHHSDTSAILTVTGVFEEQNQIENISPRHFMRTFVLVRLANDEYKIVNDIVYVTNTTTAETEVAFRYKKQLQNVKKIQQPSHVTEKEKNSMTERDSELTDMRPERSRKAVRKHFPSVVKLDGVHLIYTPSFPQWRQNYILCSSHGDPAELADQFVEHFFTLYDGEDRALLRGMYHEDAYFSVSSMYLPGQSTSLCARLSSYVAESRNLLNSSSRLKTKAALCKGPEKILTKLDKLPRTRHNPYTFTVDVLHHSDTSTILTVTGVFEEKNQIENISPRHFMRTFVLVRPANDEYQIVNDIVYVTNTTTAETEVAFRYMKPLKSLKTIQQPRLTRREKNSMIERYSQLTNMRPEWSRKCLDTVGWDLREALETFIEMYKADKIPVCGFK